MKIGFIYSEFRLSKGNGVVSQALTWRSLLEENGHEVVMWNPWDFHDIPSFDAITIFCISSNLESLVDAIYKKNKNIFIAPILDPDYSMLNAKLRSYCAIPQLRLSNRFSALRRVQPKIKGALVRSDFEAEYLQKSFGYPVEKCHKVMLPSGIGKQQDLNLECREPLCFHMSFVTDARKNVKRLIDASVKYNFPLVLAGGIHFEHEREMFEEWIKDKPNIKYLGYVSEEDKIRLFKTAKVFALPSTNEGVGLVALEAAAYGCDVVITSLGGPKEYYGNLAEVVDPYSVDEIGSAVMKLLCGNTYQPQLANHIQINFSNEKVANQLSNIYATNRL